MLSNVQDALVEDAGVQDSTWKEGGIMTGSGEPPPEVKASCSRLACAGDGGTPSTRKPTTFIAGCDALLSVLLLLAMPHACTPVNQAPARERM